MAAQRSPHTPSSIPTRTSKGSLLPTARRPSFSTPGPSSPTGVSGFRALRSLLPFGPNKHSSIPLSPTSAVSPNSNGSRFASFSAVRKSIQRERNASLSVSDLPVLVIDQATADASIELPLRKSISLHEKAAPFQPPSLHAVPPRIPTVNAPDTSQETAASSAGSPKEAVKITSDSQNAEFPTVFTPPSRAPSPSPLAELSTIIEADTSGISKHLPSASPSPSPSPTSPFHPPLAPEETSALDLSTSHLDSQVMDAMKAQETAAAKAWLAVEEPSGPDTENISFNLGALDPDLAALLSPNRMAPSDSNNTIRAKSSLDLSDSPASSSGGLRPLRQSSRPRLRPVQRPSTPPGDVVGRSPSVSPSTTTTSRAHTVRRAPPSPLSTSHPPSPVLSATIPPSPLSLSPVISSTPAVRRTQHSSSGSTSTSQTSSRRPLLGRMLQSDSWEKTASSSRSPPTRPSLDGHRPSSASASRASLDTARHRPSLDQRPSLDTNRHANLSNTVRERSSDNASSWLRRPRKRSMSVDDRTSPERHGSSSYGESSRPGSSMSNRPEWLGPRTAKAFKAAGLLGSPDSGDGANDSLSPSTAGRGKFGFGSARSSATVGRSDARSAGVVSPRPPSSAGGSARRRGSGSGSYFGSAGSQIMESPTLTMSSRDTPRSASTAPTSVSGTSSWDREEIRELKDKHAVETGALLSALSDSQRTSKVLREENSELRERLARFEAESERTTTFQRENQALREFVTELREEAGQLKLQLRLAAPVASTSRYLAPVTTQAFRLAPRPGESPRSGDESISEDSYNPATAAPVFSSTPASSKNLRKRLSSSSSIFHAPPSNMSLLLQEDGANSSDFDDRSAVSGSILASPTMVLPRIDASSNRAHRANKSITSVGSMATTSPNASMLGSPRSLLLKPEHEMHLGDMDSLDLGRGGPDADEDEDWSE
ncbi:hypothetical protein C8F04DRAFT_1251963 [Mycena alexandri]|uniref:Uncharacterized protein n=1 Tax=Mycena alexandri TaxID=1745969 RepID=A0AAD6TCJ8_9AGAR|nr:hypothetical protein C8F04DRAFT_1251963 [Mycena alexandri]